MKKSTQNLLRKVALLGVLGGTLWGTSIAAEPAATQQATTTHVTTASAGIEGPQTATVQDDGSNSPTIYDRMLRARSMARNQVEANTAIFLMPELTTALIAPMPVKCQMPTTANPIVVRNASISQMATTECNRKLMNRVPSKVNAWNATANLL